MVAIVVGHLDISYIDRLVYPWHVPLFFIVAGFFLSQKSTACEFICKKARALLLPFVLTAMAVVIALTIKAAFIDGHVLGVFLRTVASAIYGSGSDKGMTPFGIGKIGAVWFLEATFWAVLLVRFTNIGTVCCVALIAWFSVRYFWFPFNLQSGGVGALYVCIGQILYQKTNLLKRPNRLLFAVGAVSFLVFSIINPQFFLVKNICSLESVLASVLIVYFLLVAIKFISEIRCVRIAGSVIGTNTLVILCLHSFQLKCFSWEPLWILTPCTKCNGFRLPIYIAFLVLCNLIYLSAGVIAFNRIKGCMIQKQLAKGLI